jgi:FKBP-type peptidyl-prolyl cis-trans isomerase SlpA
VPDVIATSALRVRSGARVRLHFSVLLTDGTEIDTTRHGRPAECVIGDGSLLPGFEAAIDGMAAGDAGQLPIAAREAFGEHRTDNVRRLPREQFVGLDSPLEPGLIVSFAGPGGELPGVVRTVYPQRVEVDFNHPLAGRDIVFDVAILAVD